MTFDKFYFENITDDELIQNEILKYPNKIKEKYLMKRIEYLQNNLSTINKNLSSKTELFSFYIFNLKKIIYYSF